MGSRHTLRLLSAEGPDDEVVVSRKKLGKLLVETERLRKELERAREDGAKVRRELESRRRTLKRLKHKIPALPVATPSSKEMERPAMPAPAEPPPTGRRPGGQPGHPPHLCPRPDHVDESLDLPLDHCPDCDPRLGESSDSYKRFVSELIPAAPFVPRLVVHRYWCRSCHRCVQASTDRALPGRQFGSRLASPLVLLSMMGLPVRKTQEVVAAMAGLSVSTGEVQGRLEDTAKTLGPEYDAIREDVQSPYLIHPDEAPMRVGGENWWAWTFATKLSAYYVLDESRGADVVERVLGRDSPDTVVSVDWCAYNVPEGKRGVCRIHVNRHPQAVEVRHGIRPSGPRDPSPPEYERAGRAPTTFLHFA